MQTTHIEHAAQLLLNAWRSEEMLDGLPESCRPHTNAEAYAIQTQIAQLARESTFGWKIAATSAGGQKHIGVSGPLAGRLLASRVHRNGATVPLGRSQMLVGEAEFAFRMGRALAPRTAAYTQEEVMAAVESLHPAIELPDSRYKNFVTAGGAQLIADNACANYFILGAATTANWRGIDLSKHAVKAYVDGALVQEGSGANVLGDPRIAMTWIANELSSHGLTLEAGHVVTTGTSVIPFAIKVGSRVRVDFGVLGTAEVVMS